MLELKMTTLWVDFDVKNTKMCFSPSFRSKNSNFFKYKLLKDFFKIILLVAINQNKFTIIKNGYSIALATIIPIYSFII